MAKIQVEKCEATITESQESQNRACSLKDRERLPQCMLRLAQGARRLAHPELGLKQRLLRFQNRNGHLVRSVVVDDYRGI